MGVVLGIGTVGFRAVRRAVAAIVYRAVVSSSLRD